MSNPTGGALVAIEIKDTQKLSGATIRRALDSERKRANKKQRKHHISIRSDAYQIAFSIAIGAFFVVALLM